MSEGSSHNSVSAVVFLIVSIVFLFVVHVNGWLFQVNDFPVLRFRSNLLVA